MKISNYLHKSNPKYTWKLISVGKGVKSYFQYDGIGCLPFHEKVTVGNEGSYRHSYMNGDWWRKNTYRRLVQDDPTSDIYYVNKIKNKPSISNVLEQKMEFTEWVKKSTEVFWSQNPQKLNDVFDTLITRLNKKFNLNITRDVTKRSYESNISVIDKTTGKHLILTWQNCD